MQGKQSDQNANLAVDGKCWVGWACGSALSFPHPAIPWTCCLFIFLWDNVSLYCQSGPWTHIPLLLTQGDTFLKVKIFGWGSNRVYATCWLQASGEALMGGGMQKDKGSYLKASVFPCLLSVFRRLGSISSTSHETKQKLTNQAFIQLFKNQTNKQKPELYPDFV